MDTQIDLEGLRAKLKALPRKQVLKLCEQAKVSASTVQKFRNGNNDDILASSALPLMAALVALEQEAA